MSGSSSGESPGDSGGDRNRARDREEPTAGSDRTPPGGPSRASSESDGVTIEDDGLVRWFLNTEDESVIIVRDVLSSVAIVAVIGLLLFGISGIWPPLVAVESGSMEPNMHRGDLVFVVEEGRFAGDGVTDGTGVVTRESGQESGYDKFGNAGDVIVFQPNGNERQTPVIHRAHFWVEEDENWVETKANEEFVGGASCNEINSCTAEHAGFVTKGDANPGYDQHYGGARTDVVKPEWVTGKAMVRIPWLGHIRLTFDSILGGMLAPSPTAGDALVAADTGTDTGQFSSGPQVQSAGASIAVTGVAVIFAAKRFRR